MNYLMMSKEELEVLRRRARRGWVAFGAGMVALVCSASLLGYKTGRERALADVSAVRDRQEETVKHLATAWQEQHDGIGLVRSAAETIKTRDDFVRYNQENMCPDFQKATASRKTATKVSE